MTDIPILPPSEKPAGADIPFPYDWAFDLAKMGDTSAITAAYWTVDAGNCVVGTGSRASTISGTLTTSFINGGNPGQKCVINCSIQTAAGNRLVKLFELTITKGSFETGG